MQVADRRLLADFDTPPQTPGQFLVDLHLRLEHSLLVPQAVIEELQVVGRRGEEATGGGLRLGRAEQRHRRPGLVMTDRQASFIGVRWDGDKVRGVRVELTNGKSLQAGGYDDGGYTLTTYRFTTGERLVGSLPSVGRLVVMSIFAGISGRSSLGSIPAWGRGGAGCLTA